MQSFMHIFNKNIVFVRKALRSEFKEPNCKSIVSSEDQTKTILFHINDFTCITDTKGMELMSSLISVLSLLFSDCSLSFCYTDTVTVFLLKIFLGEISAQVCTVLP